MIDTLINIRNPVYSEIEQLVKDVHGWSPIDQLYSLYLLVYLTSHLEGNIIEIGSWCGRSALVLGMAAKEIGNTNVYGIDYFPNKSDWVENEDGTYSIEMTINGKVVSGLKNQTVWREPFHNDLLPFYDKNPNLLNVFKKNISNKNLQNVVLPFKGNSDLFIESVDKDFKCKLAFIDGEHSFESVSTDINNINKVLVPGGWICFDDAFSSYEGVDEAIEKNIINNVEFEKPRQLTRKLFVARKK